MKTEYKKDDVWLCGTEWGLDELIIKEVSGQFIRTQYGWDSEANFHVYANHKIGIVRRICGIPFGIKRKF